MYGVHAAAKKRNMKSDAEPNSEMWLLGLPLQQKKRLERQASHHSTAAALGVTAACGVLLSVRTGFRIMDTTRWGMYLFI